MIIDGGKGQLGAAAEAIHELGLDGSMTLVGLAKNEEELFFTGDQQSKKLPYNSSSLKFIRSVRDEVHRFGITFHRQKRSKGTFKNELEDIPGIGNATASLLLKEYKSVKNIISAALQQDGAAVIGQLIGNSKASMIIEYFGNKKQE